MFVSWSVNKQNVVYVYKVECYLPWRGMRVCMKRVSVCVVDYIIQP